MQIILTDKTSSASVLHAKYFIGLEIIAKNYMMTLFLHAIK